MNQKKVFKIVGIILVAIILLFLIYSLRNFLIVRDLRKRVAKYIDSDNFHVKTTITKPEDISVLDYYKKGKRQAVFIERKNTAGEIMKISIYDTGERIDTFTVTNDSKTIKINHTGSLHASEVLDILETDNLYQMILCSSVAVIKSVKLNDTRCYKVKHYLSPNCSLSDPEKEFIIDKETGLLAKTILGDVENIREYEFDNVDDAIFVEPDISQYTLVED